MTNIRKILSLIALTLVIFIIRDLTIQNGIILADSIQLIIGLILWISGAMIILLKKPAHPSYSDIDEMVVIDGIIEENQSFSIQNLIVRVVLFFSILIVNDLYIQEFPQSDVSTILRLVASLIMTILLIFYKTPIGHKTKQTLSQNTNTYDPKKQHYTKNQNEHHFETKLEHEDHKPTELRCPYCKSSAVIDANEKEPMKQNTRQAFKLLAAFVFDTELTHKKQYLCLDCKERW